jgi:enterochelin esterase-like enzyme
MIQPTVPPRASPRPATSDVRVHYPLGEGRLVLRTDADWERDLEPTRASAGEGRFDFRVPIEGTHREFKVLLRRGERTDWAQGENGLALRASGRLDVFPYFSPDETCHVCDQHAVPSSFAASGHRARVFLPPGYGENTLERYPVVFMQDGHNLFFPEESFAGETWRMQETLDVLQRMSLTRRLIVVGVYPSDRMREYTLPGCEEYGRALVDELVPWVRAHYRTLEGPESTAVMGSSLGGVVSFHLAWRHPEVFGAAACLSTTFGYADDFLQRVAREPKPPIRLYLDSGWPHDNYEATRGMRNVLVKRGFAPGRDLHYLAFPNARHDERSWATRVHVPLQLLFGDMPR